MAIEWQIGITIVSIIIIPLFGLMIAVGRLLQIIKTQGENIHDIKVDLHELCDNNTNEHRALWTENDNQSKRISNLEGYRNGRNAPRS